MITQPTRLILLVQLVERLPLSSAPAKCRRGHPYQYSDLLFLKALVIMLVRRVTTVRGLLQMLAEDTAEMRTLRALLTGGGYFPCRRTWERRLHAIPTTLPEYIACFGAALVRLIQPWCQSGRAVALDSTGLRAPCDQSIVWKNLEHTLC
jgi:hypothetical protein